MLAVGLEDIRRLVGGILQLDVGDRDAIADASNGRGSEASFGRMQCDGDPTEK